MKKEYISPNVLIAEMGAVSLYTTSNIEGGEYGGTGDRAEARQRVKRYNYYDRSEETEIDNTQEPEF